MKPGPHNITKPEKTRGGQRGDMHRIIKQTSIMPAISFMYSTEGISSLRACPHGSAPESKKGHSDTILKNHNVKLVDITKGKANGNVYEADGAKVVYDDSKIIQQMDNKQFQQQIIEHRKSSLDQTNVVWSSYRDCPFFPRRLESEYRSISNTGWYHKMYQIMVALAGNAISKKYPITADEIAVLCRELDAETGNWYANRPLQKEADRALEYVYKNM